MSLGERCPSKRIRTGRPGARLLTGAGSTHRGVEGRAPRSSPRFSWGGMYPSPRKESGERGASPTSASRGGRKPADGPSARPFAHLKREPCVFDACIERCGRAKCPSSENRTLLLAVSCALWKVTSFNALKP